MLRRHPDGWSAWRQALFALVPVLLGLAVVTVGEDPQGAGSHRIEATRSTLKLAPKPSVTTTEPLGTSAAASGAAPEVVLEAPAAADGAASDSPPATLPPAATATEPAPAPADQEAWGSAPAGGTSASTVPRSTASPASEAAEDPYAAVTTTTAPAPAPTITTTTTSPPPARTGRSASPSAAAEVVPLTNADRTQAGLGALSRNGCLDSVASGFAEQMAGNGVMAHNSGAGAAVLECRPGATWGDNVGRALPCDTARLEREWMASPSHRRNILTGAFRYIGVGAWTADDGTCFVQVLFSS